MKIIKRFESFSEDSVKKTLQYYEPYTSGKNGEEIWRKVGWESVKLQYKRFEVLTQYMSDGQNVLDYGCGYGELCKFLEEKYPTFEYEGVDINPKLLTLANKEYPDYNFKLIRSVNDVDKSYDWIVASGVFNVGITPIEFAETLKVLLNHSKVGIAFNVWIDGKNGNIPLNKLKLVNNGSNFNHYNPKSILLYLKDLSTNVEAINGSIYGIPKEYTFIIKK